MNVFDQFKNINEYFSPKIIEEIENLYVKIAKIKGDDVPWHAHDNEDELFYIVEGELLMEIEGEKPYFMKKGDIKVIPKKIKHRVSSKDECQIMLIEKKSTLHTGEVVCSITKSIEDQENI